MDHKVIVLLSGGIDSPVAAHLLAESGGQISLLSLDNRPFTDDKTLKTVKELAERLKNIHGNITHHIGSFGHVQKKIAAEGNQHLRCLLCRRMMYRAAERAAEYFNADAIATGESLGQVASQTLSNIAAVDEAVDVTIHRPLIGLDKNKVIEIAKEIGTYEISIQPTICCMLTPEEPSIRSEADLMNKEEEKLDVPSLLKEIEFRRGKV
ncbi:MAG: phosphoadenosine phosphosulfate reductase family protein [Candidatus Thermoplasmatota archaeon]